jgi:cephalosporin hydroxylase
MKITIDTDAKTIEIFEPGGAGGKQTALYSKAGFELISDLWLTTGWGMRYSYTFSWLGRPIIQLPEDMLRIQEVIHAIAPDVIIECGIAHGGSLIFYASLLKVIGDGEGRVVGVDIDIRAHNRRAIEDHALAPAITLIEGSSIEPATVAAVAACVKPGDKVLVLLDSNHTRDHVLAELRLYAPLVSVGSYIVAADGVMAALTDVPGGQPSWGSDNPTAAAKDFIAERDDFILETPGFEFSESELSEPITYWPGGYLKRIA